VEPEVLILGLVLLLVGWLTGIGILTTIGIILLVVGAVLMLLGSVNRPVLGRRYWY
jgi:membrane-bound ClpP family serine protease